MKCKICNKKIPVKRLEALPKTEICVKCSENEEFNKKNYAEVHINGMIYYAFFK